MNARLAIGVGLLLWAAPLSAQQPGQADPAPSAAAPMEVPAAGTNPSPLSEPAQSGSVLTLERALGVARQHAPELRQAAAQSAAARARVGIARAPLLPQISATAGYTFNVFRGRSGVTTTSNGIVIPSSDTGWDTRNLFTAGLRATQLIWDFGQVWNVKEAAKLNALAQEQTEQATQLEIDYNVRSAFLTAGANKALREVARATLVNQDRHRDQIQGFVEVGTRPQIDLAQARTDVANAQLAVLRADNAYVGSKAELNRAQGIKETSTAYDVSDELPNFEEGEDQGIDGLTSRAEQNRPEFAALRSQVLAQQASLRSIKGQYGPSLSAVAGADESGYELSNLGTNLSLGASLSWPIFQGGITNSRVDEAKALLNSLDAQLDGLRADLRLALSQAVLSVQAAQAALVVARELVELAKERQVLAEGRYETGVGNVIELADAELALRDAQTQRVSAEYDLAIARTLLRRSLGRF